MPYSGEWIDKKLLISAAENAFGGAGLQEGQTMHINHDGCPAGRDQRERLYITLTNDGSLLGYCHNCGSRGYVKGDRVPNIHRSGNTLYVDRSKGTSFDMERAVGQSLTPLYPTSPTDPKSPIGVYLDMYSIEPSYAFIDNWLYGDVMNDYTQLLVFPCVRGDDTRTVTGCQVRKIGSSKKGEPKYLTFGEVAPHVLNVHDSPTVVVVEDRTSGVRVNQAGYASMCMHGSMPLNGEIAHKLSVMFDNIIMWYDNDNEYVNNAVTQSASVLSLFTSNYSVVSWYNDPKKYTKEEITAVVMNALVNLGTNKP